jgi:hypothetical protein
MTEPREDNPLTTKEVEALRAWQTEADAAYRRTCAELAKRPTRIYCDSFRITPQQMRALRIPRDVPHLPEHLRHLAPRISEPKPPTEADAERRLVALEGQSVLVIWHGGTPPAPDFPDPARPVLVPRRFVHGGWLGSAMQSSVDLSVIGWTDDPLEAGASARRALRQGDVVRVRLTKQWFRNAASGLDINPADLGARRAVIFEALAWYVEVDPTRVVVGAGFPVGDLVPFAVCDLHGPDD